MGNEKIVSSALDANVRSIWNAATGDGKERFTLQKAYSCSKEIKQVFVDEGYWGTPVFLAIFTALIGFVIWGKVKRCLRLK